MTTGLEHLKNLSVSELRRVEMLLKLRDARLKFATQNHISTRGYRLNLTDFPHIKPIYNSLARKIVLQGCVQSMKAQPLDAKVHTPQGWRLMGDIRGGDVVSTPDGGSAKVLGVFPQGEVPIYRLIFSDGRSTEACADHLWKVSWTPLVFKPSRGLACLGSQDFEVLSTTQIADRLCSSGGRFKIPLSCPVDKPEAILPIDPYLLGLMLGDGEFSEKNIRFASTDIQLLESFNTGIAPFGLCLKKDESSSCTYFLVNIDRNKEMYGKERLVSELSALGLLNTKSHSKFIPDIYKNGSLAQRLSILQGLLDTDGGGRLSISISTVSNQLAKDIQELVWSLGGLATVALSDSKYTYKGEERQGAVVYRVCISHPHPRSLLRLERKKLLFSETNRRKKTLGPTLTHIQYVGRKQAKCILIDHPEHLYVTDDYIVTHNTEFVIVDHLAAASLGLAVFYVVSKYEARNTYVQNRIDRVVEQVSEYKKFIKKGFFDSIAIKHFGKGTVRYVGSNAPADFREYSADCLKFDTPILTDFDSWISIKDLSVGDDVLAFDGVSVVKDRVVFKKYIGTRPCYKVSFDDGSMIDCTLGSKLFVNGEWRFLYELVDKREYVRPDDGSVCSVRVFDGANAFGDDYWRYGGDVADKDSLVKAGSRPSTEKLLFSQNSEIEPVLSRYSHTNHNNKQKELGSVCVYEDNCESLTFSKPSFFKTGTQSVSKENNYEGGFGFIGLGVSSLCIYGRRESLPRFSHSSPQLLCCEGFIESKRPSSLFGDSINIQKVEGVEDREAVVCFGDKPTTYGALHREHKGVLSSRLGLQIRFVGENICLLPDLFEPEIESFWRIPLSDLFVEVDFWDKLEDWVGDYLPEEEKRPIVSAEKDKKEAALGGRKSRNCEVRKKTIGQKILRKNKDGCGHDEGGSRERQEICCWDGKTFDQRGEKRKRLSKVNKKIQRKESEEVDGKTRSSCNARGGVYSGCTFSWENKTEQGGILEERGCSPKETDSREESKTVWGANTGGTFAANQFSKICTQAEESLYGGSNNLLVGGDWKVRSVLGEKKIISVEFVGFDDVYDIQTKQHHNFFADGSLVHNCAYIDEYDDCDQDNLLLIPERMQASPYEISRCLGNPTLPNYGINEQYLQSDQRQWHLPCLSCGKPRLFNWFTHAVQPITDVNDVAVDYVLRDKDWSPGKRDIHLICDYCGGILSKKEGFWKAMAESSTEGYAISSIAANTRAVSYLYDVFRKAIHHPARMTRFRNAYLGVPDEGENVKLTAESLSRCVDQGYTVIDQDDRAHIADDQCDGPCSMGVDVGGSLDVRISKIVGDKRLLVFVGKINDFEELDNLVARYNVKCCVVDSMPESRKVQEFQQRSLCDIWLCRVRGDGTDRQLNRDENKQILTIDRTELLDRNFNDILAKKSIFPENFRTLLGGNYLKEMTVLVRRAEKLKKNDDTPNADVAMRWSKGEDHQRFADAFDLLAADMIKSSTVVDCFVG